MSAIPRLGVYADTNISGVTEWIYGDPRRDRMRMPDWFLDCVGYLCVDQLNGEKASGGTFFFVCVDSEVHTGFYVYAVTARHCIDKIAKTHIDMHLRLNTRDGKFGFIKNIPVTAWTFPESTSSDVAILPILPPQPTFIIRAIPSDRFVTQSLIDRESIGIGDELYVTGLFTQRQGLQQNIPIVRSGIISAMPGEIDSPEGRYAAYLAEIYSLGGLSGSPVYVMVNRGRQEPDAALKVARDYYLLGMIRGHWYQPNALPSLSGAIDHTGIAIVTPATEITDLLQREDMVNDRRRRDKELSAANPPVMD